MFDIGFSEMMVIAVIALIVLGPEKLPRVARTAGHLLGRMQRYVNDVKSDINREIELDELRKLQKEMQSTAHDIEQTVKGQISSAYSLPRVSPAGSVSAAPKMIACQPQKWILESQSDAVRTLHSRWVE